MGRTYRTQAVSKEHGQLPIGYRKCLQDIRSAYRTQGRKDFVTRIPLAQELRPTIDKWNFIKLRGFCTDKATSNL